MTNRNNFQRYRDLIGVLGMTQRGASKFLQIGERTSRRWANDEIDVPLAVIMLLEVMVEFKLTPHAARKLAKASDSRTDYTDQRGDR